MAHLSIVFDRKQFNRPGLDPSLHVYSGFLIGDHLKWAWFNKKWAWLVNISRALLNRKPPRKNSVSATVLYFKFASCLRKCCERDSEQTNKLLIS